MMNTAVQQQQQQTNSNGQVLVTPHERQNLIEKLRSKFPANLSIQIEKEAFEKSRGVKFDYLNVVQTYLQRLHNQLSQQRQGIINVPRMPNSATNVLPRTCAPSNSAVQPAVNKMPNSSSGFRVAQPMLQINNSSASSIGQACESSIPSAASLDGFSAPQPAAPSITAAASTFNTPQQASGFIQSDYLMVQSRYPLEPSANALRQQTVALNGCLLATHQSSSLNYQGTGGLNQAFSVNPSLSSITPSSTGTISAAAPAPVLTLMPTKVVARNASTGDPFFQPMLPLNSDVGSSNMQTSNPTSMATAMPESAASAVNTNSNINNSVNLARPPPFVQQSLPSSSETLALQIQQSSSTAMPQNSLNNSNGPSSSTTQAGSMSGSTSHNTKYASPTNHALSAASSGSITSPDAETTNLIKYLKENIHRLELLFRKFSSEANTDKLIQIQSAYQQAMRFVNNPTHEYLQNAKRIRNLLERLPISSQQVNNPSLLPTGTAIAMAAVTATTTTTSVAVTTAAANTATTTQTITNLPTVPKSLQSNCFNQCLRATKEYLSRDQKDRINIAKRYLEPLSDVVNGVPHKIIRLDTGSCSTKFRAPHRSSLMSSLREEIERLPKDVYSIEYVTLPGTKDPHDDSDRCLNNPGIVLRCKLLEKSNPLLPPLRLRLTASYPEQTPEILSLTKTTPPRLEFTDGHPFLDRISSMFVYKIFALNPQHTITDILNIWRQSVQGAL